MVEWNCGGGSSVVRASLSCILPLFFFSSRRRHTSCALVTGVQTCALPIFHADSAELAFEQLTLLVKESEGGADLARDDIRSLLKLLVDVVVQTKKVEGRFRVTEIYFDPENRL